MFKHPSAIGITIIFIAATLSGQDSPPPPASVTLETRIVESRTVGVLEQGTLELSLTNETGGPISAVSIEIVTPVTGLLDHRRDAVGLGTVARDARQDRQVDFALERRFLDSGEPLWLRITYIDEQGAPRETTVPSTPVTGGGL